MTNQTLHQVGNHLAEIRRLAGSLRAEKIDDARWPLIVGFLTQVENHARTLEVQTRCEQMADAKAAAIEKAIARIADIDRHAQEIRWMFDVEGYDEGQARWDRTAITNAAGDALQVLVQMRRERGSDAERGGHV